MGQAPGRPSDPGAAGEPWNPSRRGPSGREPEPLSAEGVPGAIRVCDSPSVAAQNDGRVMEGLPDWHEQEMRTLYGWEWGEKGGSPYLEPKHYEVLADYKQD